MVDFNFVTATTDVVGGFVGGDLSTCIFDSVTAVFKAGGVAVVIGDLGRFVVAVVNNGVIGQLVGRMGVVI